jgi:hypothetical protein
VTREFNDHGVAYAAIVAGRHIRLDSTDGPPVRATIIRMDTPTLGRCTVYPEHGQGGGSYSAIFHADNVAALLGSVPEEQP